MIDITLNPGYKLREVLEGIFPFNSSSSGFIFKMDQAMLADSEFAKLSYYSSLNYIVRRLIVTSDFIKRKFDRDDYPQDKYLQEIKKFLRSNFKLPDSTIDTIHTFLIDSLVERNKVLSGAKKRKVLENGESRRYSCYICGKELIYNKAGYSEDHPDLAEVEHLWPRSLGGSNELYNLEVACRACNSVKTDFIDYSDY